MYCVCSPVMESLSGWMWRAARGSGSPSVTSVTWPLPPESGTMPECTLPPCPPANQAGPSPRDSAHAGTVSVSTPPPAPPHLHPLLFCLLSFPNDATTRNYTTTQYTSDKNHWHCGEKNWKGMEKKTKQDLHIRSQNQPSCTEAECHRARDCGPREAPQTAYPQDAQQSAIQDLPHTSQWRGGTHNHICYSLYLYYYSNYCS